MTRRMCPRRATWRSSPARCSGTFPSTAISIDIGALQLGDEIIANHNGLLGRYPGADGMKTGFTCPAGFNVVATATQGGRRLIVVVLGSPSARERTIEAAHLFDRGFAKWGGGEGALENLPASAALTRARHARRRFVRAAIAPPSPPPRRKTPPRRPGGRVRPERARSPLIAGAGAE